MGIDGPLRILEGLAMDLKPFEVMVNGVRHRQLARALVFRQADIRDDFPTELLCLIETKDRRVFFMVLKIIGFSDLLDALFACGIERTAKPDACPFAFHHMRTGLLRVVWEGGAYLVIPISPWMR